MKCYTAFTNKELITVHILRKNDNKRYSAKSEISKTLGLGLDIQAPVLSGLCLKRCSYPSLSLGLSLDPQKFPSFSVSHETETYI